MDLTEIEAAADELATELHTTTSKGQAEMLAWQIQGLANLAGIKATVAEAVKAKQALFRQAWGGNPEPTKPAVDRLHELVSYGEQMEASNRTVEYPCADAADAYQDMASKLQEILKEGTL